MTSPIVAIPYRFDTGDPTKNTRILDWMAARPSVFVAATTPELRRLAAAAALTDPRSLHWEVWTDKDLVGILQLSRIIPTVDALIHFLFFDGNLLGRRRFLWQFLGRCFQDLGLQRISWECPEHVPLVNFMRSKLHFRYEGEGRVVNHPAIDKTVRHKKLEKPDVWVARQGSRRQGAHFHEGEWKDIILLRLLRSEYQSLADEGRG